MLVRSLRLGARELETRWLRTRWQESMRLRIRMSLVGGSLDFSGLASLVVERIGATGAVGVGRIRASLPNGYSTIFTVDYTPAQYDITFTDSHRGKLHFESAQTCVGFNEPPVDTVPAGETVRWVNDDLSAMRLVSVGEPSFPDSPPIAYGESYTTVFSRPGTYRYTAENHPTLTGTIVVR